MVSADMCKHDWPGSGCKECKAEAQALEDKRFADLIKHCRDWGWNGMDHWEKFAVTLPNGNILYVHLTHEIAYAEHFPLVDPLLPKKP